MRAQRPVREAGERRDPQRKEGGRGQLHQHGAALVGAHIDRPHPPRLLLRKRRLAKRRPLSQRRDRRRAAAAQHTAALDQVDGRGKLALPHHPLRGPKGAHGRLGRQRVDLRLIEASQQPRATQHSPQLVPAAEAAQPCRHVVAPREPPQNPRADARHRHVRRVVVQQRHSAQHLARPVALQRRAGKPRVPRRKRAAAHDEAVDARRARTHHLVARRRVDAPAPPRQRPPLRAVEPTQQHALRTRRLDRRHRRAVRMPAAVAAAFVAAAAVAGAVAPKELRSDGEPTGSLAAARVPRHRQEDLRPVLLLRLLGRRRRRRHSRRGRGRGRRPGATSAAAAAAAAAAVSAAQRRNLLRVASPLCVELLPHRRREADGLGRRLAAVGGVRRLPRAQLGARRRRLALERRHFAELLDAKEALGLRVGARRLGRPSSCARRHVARRSLLVSTASVRVAAVAVRGLADGVGRERSGGAAAPAARRRRDRLLLLLLPRPCQVECRVRVGTAATVGGRRLGA